MFTFIFTTVIKYCIYLVANKKCIQFLLISIKLLYSNKAHMAETNRSMVVYLWTEFFRDLVKLLHT